MVRIGFNPLLSWQHRQPQVTTAQLRPTILTARVAQRATAPDEMWDDGDGEDKLSGLLGRLQSLVRNVCHRLTDGMEKIVFRLKAHSTIFVFNHFRGRDCRESELEKYLFDEVYPEKMSVMFSLTDKFSFLQPYDYGSPCLGMTRRILASPYKTPTMKQFMGDVLYMSIGVPKTQQEAIRKANRLVCYSHPDRLMQFVHPVQLEEINALNQFCRLLRETCKDEKLYNSIRANWKESPQKKPELWRMMTDLFEILLG